MLFSLCNIALRRSGYHVCLANILSNVVVVFCLFVEGYFKGRFAKKINK